MMKMAFSEADASSVKKRKTRLKSKGNTTRGDHATRSGRATRGGRAAIGGCATIGGRATRGGHATRGSRAIRGGRVTRGGRTTRGDRKGCDPAEDNPSTGNNVATRGSCATRGGRKGCDPSEDNPSTGNSVATRGGRTTRGNRRGCDPAEDNPSTGNNVSQESHNEICINMEPEKQSHSTPSSHVETKNTRKRKHRLENQRSLKLAKKSLESPMDREKVSLLSHPHEAETTSHLKNFAIEEIINGGLLENNVSQESQNEICLNMEPEMGQSHSTPSSDFETTKTRKRKRRLQKRRFLKLAKKSLESPTDRKKVSLLSHPHEAETTGHLKKFAIEEVMNGDLLKESIDCSFSEKIKLLSANAKERSMVISDAHRSKDLDMPEMGQSHLAVNFSKEKNEQKHNTLQCGEVSGASVLTTLNVKALKEDVTSISPNGDFCSVDENDNSLILEDPDRKRINMVKRDDENTETVDHSTPSSHVETKKMRKRKRQREKRRSLKSAKKSLESPTEDRKKLSLLSHPHEAETTGHLKHFAKDVMNEILLEESIDCSISEKTELSSNTKESSMVIADAHSPKDFENTLMTKKDDDCLETKECLAESNSDYTPGQTKRKRKKGRRNRKLVDTLEGILNFDVEDNKKNASSNCSNEVDATSLHEHSTTNDLVKNVLVESIKQKVPHSSACDATNDNIGAVLEKNSSSRISSSSNERDATGFLKKKLLILDVNGLLVDFVPYHPDGYTPDIVISRKAVFKRPFCDDFLQFCFERFEVGIWSSRTRKNLNMLVESLMRDSRHKLLFCWDQSHCTTTSFTTVENNEKPLVLKELKKIWDTLEPNLPWKKGEYNASNTLLLDDSPYKALCNPANTAVFPTTYQFTDSDDSSLGPGGDLRTYLEGVSTAENVQKYVEQNPFGQRSISESDQSWRFYLKVINSVK